MESTWARVHTESTWANNNPYLHTSRPYVVQLHRPVRSDEQYPAPSLEYPSLQYPAPSLEFAPLQYPDHFYSPVSETRVSDPLYESINSVRFPPRSHPEQTVSPAQLRDGAATVVSPSRPRDELEKTSAKNPRVGQDNLVITSEDSVEEILRKLSGEEPEPGLDQGSEPVAAPRVGVKSNPTQGTRDTGPEKTRKTSDFAGTVLERFDSPDISKELETAFFRLDSGETEI